MRIRLLPDLVQVLGFCVGVVFAVEVLPGLRPPIPLKSGEHCIERMRTVWHRAQAQKPGALMAELERQLARLRCPETGARYTVVQDKAGRPLIVCNGVHRTVVLRPTGFLLWRWRTDRWPANPRLVEPSCLWQCAVQEGAPTRLAVRDDEVDARPWWGWLSRTYSGCAGNYRVEESPSPLFAPP